MHLKLVFFGNDKFVKNETSCQDENVINNNKLIAISVWRYNYIQFLRSTKHNVKLYEEKKNKICVCI